MSELAYLNLDLLIERAEPDYRVRVLASPAGESRPVWFRVPFSDLEVENFLLRIGSQGRNVRRSALQVRALKDFGGRLFEAVFPAELRVNLAISQSRADAMDAGLRIRLRFSDCPELSELPWEYLYDREHNRFLCLSDRTPLVRYLEVSDPVRVVPVTPPLRILVIIASPSDLQQLDSEQEWSNVTAALSQLRQRGRVEVVRLAEPTLSALQRELRRDTYHIFHFIGHGGFDPGTQDGMLAMEDDHGRSRLVGGEDLGMLLHDHRSLRLAVLNSCEGARGDRSDPFSGTAQSLVQQGIPAVVAMQFEITDDAAITFGHVLYEAIADGYPLDAATAEARKAIYADGNLTEWGTPVLYLRAPDGRIFDIQDRPPPVLPPSSEEQARQEAEERARQEAEQQAQEAQERGGAMAPSLPGRIFVSYRRQETAWPAGRLYDVLAEHFPPEQVFKDVDNINPGDDFVGRVMETVASCDVLLALIGRQWLTITDETGQRRLDNPEDFVRVEIETALKRKIRVIPILVDDARMPGANELPATLAPLVRRNAVEINPLTFDTKQLIAVVRKTLAELQVRGTTTGSVSPTSTARPDRWTQQVPGPDAEQMKVFLCHASEDKAAVRDLYQELRAADMNPWLDEIDIWPGREWDVEIREAIRTADIVLVLLSTTSVGKTGYIQKEVRFALDRADEKPAGETYIIPVKLDDCVVPERLTRWQWVNLFDTNGDERLMSTLRYYARQFARELEAVADNDSLQVAATARSALGHTRPPDPTYSRGGPPTSQPGGSGGVYAVNRGVTTIDLICEVCGASNPPGTEFCTNCGSYLAWDRTVLAKPRGQPAKRGSTTLLVVGGRYELGELLGRGGMAEVRLAVDQRLGRSVAVKQLRTDLATDPTFQARFRREAQSAAGLNHPTIVAVYDTGEEIDPLTGVSIPYIVMELVEGPSLRDVLREGRKIIPERAMEVTQGILDALSYSHKAGIVHRDIKPANVVLTSNGGVKVMDFGIARAVADTSATMTQTAAVIGTAQYLSPEQARGETVDARSDLYSAGCVLYELLLGRPPFIGDSPVSVAYQHVREAPTPPSQLDPEITPEIDAVVLKALAKDPADRYQSATEMKADISRLLSGQRPTAS